MYYATTSIFWSLDRQSFLQVPYDCTKVGVSDALSTSERDIPLQWSGLTFHNAPGPDQGSLSLVGYTYEEPMLVAPGSLV
jgi:hypothetical protein